MFQVPDDGRITRAHFEEYANDLRKKLEKLNKIEAFFVHAAFIRSPDYYGLTDGDKSYTLQEFDNVCKALPEDVSYKD